jgi:transcriptional regulator with XRE-family HTH domain
MSQIWSEGGMARKAPKRASSFDHHVGLRLRAKRIELGLSQTRVANAIGVTNQQVQKYENGKNRIPAGRLWELAKYFKVPINYFFEGLK